jgi:Ca2+-dependent lipid-binding protein
MHIDSIGSRSYYLRAYLYQARGVYASDRSGLSDPYAIVSFDCYSKFSRVVEQNLCPKWDQTLIFDKQVEIFGDTTESLPYVVVDFFDKDKLVGYH